MRTYKKAFIKHIISDSIRLIEFFAMNLNYLCAFHLKTFMLLGFFFSEITKKMME